MLNINQLVEGKYYRFIFKHESYDTLICFKFYKLFYDKSLLTNGVIIQYNSGIIDNNYFSSSTINSITYHDCDLFEEVSINIIVDYLPETDIDKKYYSRKNKIENLLYVHR